MKYNVSDTTARVMRGMTATKDGNKWVWADTDGRVWASGHSKGYALREAWDRAASELG